MTGYKKKQIRSSKLLAQISTNNSQIESYEAKDHPTLGYCLTKSVVLTTAEFRQQALGALGKFQNWWGRIFFIEWIPLPTLNQQQQIIEADTN